MRVLDRRWSAENNKRESEQETRSRKWTLPNQVTRESEAKQKHELSMLLKLTYVDRNVWQSQSQEILRCQHCQVEILLAINTNSVI